MFSSAFCIVFYLFIYFIVLLFICAYNAWVISPCIVEGTKSFHLVKVWDS
jgi:hypothetical protein